MSALHHLGTPRFLIPAGVVCLVVGFTGLDSSPQWLLGACVLLGLGQANGCSVPRKLAIVGAVFAVGFVFLIGFVSLFAAAWIAAWPVGFAAAMLGMWAAACVIVMRTSIRRLRRTAAASAGPAAHDLEDRQ
ncbi:MAG TPA: hypothetical protein VLD62_08885 [Acidimicrobiia bacterium]|nr:hypothetical protein [Acidimicrobiia bacterium]